MVGTHPPQDSSADSFDKDIEIQSTVAGNSSGILQDDTDVEEGTGGSNEKDDIERYPAGLTALESREREEHGAGGKGTGVAGILSRISTRTSVKDLGPPPDGGLVGWTQGA